MSPTCGGCKRDLETVRATPRGMACESCVPNALAWALGQLPDASPRTSDDYNREHAKASAALALARNEHGGSK